MTDPLDLSVLIPARNEVENLPSLLMEIRAALAAEEPEHLTVACRAGGLRQWLARRPERPALEMLQSGNWFIPHRAAEIYGDKPPLFMWTVALFSQLTGSPKVALYLPGLMSAATITWVLHDLGRRLWNRRIGVIAALLFLATYQSYSILRTGQIDSFLCLWVTLGF